MGLIYGAKCDGCWERVENCTCGRYTKLDDYGPTVRYNGEPKSRKRLPAPALRKDVVHQYEIDELKESIDDLKDKFNALIEELRNKNAG